MRNGTALALLLAMLAISGARLHASGDQRAPEVTIAFESPQTEFVVGEPILLTVVFRSIAQRDLTIKGFDPQFGSSVWVRISSDGGFEKWRATTDLAVERLSGKPSETNDGFTLSSGGNPFLLKRGGCQKRSFDLMQTLNGESTVRSPGRYRVCLTFKVEAQRSQGWKHDSDPPEWEGEVRAVPVEIAVVAKEPVPKNQRTPRKRGNEEKGEVKTPVKAGKE